jgi:hypothetical protein
MFRPSILLVLLVLVALVLGALGLGVAYLETKTIQGTVTAENGKPLAQASVTVAGRSALTDDKGAFAIQFPRGEWELRAFANGYQQAAQKVNAGDLWEQQFVASLILQPQAWRGRVVSSETQAPIPTARVELDGQVLETDAQGEFVAFGVRTGTKIKISQPGYRTVNVTVESAGDADQKATIPLAPAEMRVLVVDASSQKPLPGVRVQANGASLNTDANGSVLFKGLAEGTEIRARAPGYAEASANTASDAVVTLQLQPTTLTGRIVDPAGQAIEDALILLGAPAPSTGNSIGASASVLQGGAAGTFTLEDFSAVGKVYVKKPGYLLGAFELTRGGAQSFALTPFRAKGIHLYYGIKRQEAEQVLTQFRGTQMNAVVFDVKEDPGYLLWDSQTPMAKSIGAYLPRDYTANDQVATCREFGLYCIARLTVFKDSLLAQNRPDLALHNAAGGLLYENSAYWTDPAAAEVQDYHIGLALELAAMGFDEIQYDYIRYPGTRNLLLSEFGDADYRVGTIRAFLDRSAEALRPTTAFFSGDVFGLTTAIDDEQGIGQVWEEVAPPFDYISPMMYPSTWRYATNLWGGGFGIRNCSDAYACPYEIMHYGTLKAQERTTNRWTLVRPWLQAYQMNLSDMLKQAQGSDDANSAGYLFWNNLAVYPNGLFE